MKVLSIAILLLFAAFSLPAQHAAEGPAAETHETGGHDDMIVWKWANFAILAAGLGFLMAKYAKPFFASRSRAIVQGLTEAAALRAQAEARAVEMDARLRKLDADVESLRGDARAEAAAEGERMRRDAERDLAKIQANAEREIESAAKAARQDLKDHSAALALDLARQKVAARMTPDGQDQLVRAFAGNLRRENS
ncbi:MAG: ATP synthase F0 subunit B [Bryobacteraceae bacterium]